MANTTHPTPEDEPEQTPDQADGADDKAFDISDIQPEPSDDDTAIFAAPKPVPEKPAPTFTGIPENLSSAERRSLRMKDEMNARSLAGLPEKLLFDEQYEGQLRVIAGQCHEKIVQAGDRALEEQQAQDLLIIISALLDPHFGGVADRAGLRSGLKKRLAEYAQKVDREIIFDEGTYNAAFRELMPYCHVPGSEQASTQETAADTTTTETAETTQAAPLSAREIAAAKQRERQRNDETVQRQQERALQEAARALRNLPPPPSPLIDDIVVNPDTAEGLRNLEQEMQQDPDKED